MGIGGRLDGTGGDSERDDGCDFETFLRLDEDLVGLFVGVPSDFWSCGIGGGCIKSSGEVLLGSSAPVYLATLISWGENGILFERNIPVIRS